MKYTPYHLIYKLHLLMPTTYFQLAFSGEHKDENTTHENLDSIMNIKSC